jgi:hypothetical protein
MMLLLCGYYRLREHVEDPSKDPILIFPEGITIFKYDSLNLGSEIYTV